MENKNIIIILLAIIIILSAVVGALFLQSNNAKEPTEVKITSSPTLYEGDGLEIELARLDGTAIPKEKVDVIIANEKGDVLVKKTVETDSEGKAKIDFDLKKGEYDVNVTFRGNENYKDDAATQKLSIDETATKVVSDNSNKNPAEVNNYPKYNF